MLFDHVIQEWDGSLSNVAVEWGTQHSSLIYKDGTRQVVSTDYLKSIIFCTIDPNWPGDAWLGDLP